MTGTLSDHFDTQTIGNLRLPAKFALIRNWPFHFNYYRGSIGWWLDCGAFMLSGGYVDASWEYRTLLDLHLPRFTILRVERPLTVEEQDEVLRDMEEENALYHEAGRYTAWHDWH